MCRNMFAGGNTGQGFTSFYNYIGYPKLTKAYILKGGPGTGKSTLMRTVVSALREHAENISLELFWCSGALSSLDGVYIPGLGIAIVDGSPPHALEPELPGAAEEIINLGVYWDSAKLTCQRGKIERFTEEIKRTYSRAYGYLSAAKLYNAEAEAYMDDANGLDYSILEEITNRLITEVLPQNAWVSRRAPLPRRLFASAIGPEGAVNHIASLMSSLDKLYLMVGQPTSANDRVLKKLCDAARLAGVFTEVYHCCLDPEQIEHVILPELGIGIFTSREPHLLSAGMNGKLVDLSKCIVEHRVKSALADQAEVLRLYRESMLRAVGLLARARETQLDLQSIYIDAMDFSGVDCEAHKLIGNILARLE